MFNTPASPSHDSIIWRYLSLDKFIDIILTQTIKFTIASIASDKNEVKWILKNLENTKEYKTHSEGALKHINKLRNSTYISCWVMKENESRSFWASYLDSDKQGIAIKSNVGSFVNAVEWNKFKFTCNIVDYRNEFNFEELQSNSIAINTKNKAYKEEDEVRFTINGLDEILSHREPADSYIQKFDEYHKDVNNRKKVIELKINLDVLTKEIMISPYCSEWQKKNIIKLINDYNPELLDRITNSEINE